MRRKYPKTMHLPWSPGTTSDDRLLTDVKHLQGMDIVVTEKLDGENTTIYNDHTHARSMDSKHHDSRNWLRAMWGAMKHDIPVGMRICGENMYAEHSIRYEELTSFFYVFAIFDSVEGIDTCLSWDDTVAFSSLLGLETVPVLYRGPFDIAAINACMTGVSIYGPEQEGFVVRNDKSFPYDTFQQNTAKFVRKDHVQTDQHWSVSWKPNKMKSV